MRGVKTQKNYELSSLGISSEMGSKYQPLSYSHLKEVFWEAKKMRPNSKVIDIGSGLGRALIIAKEVGFVELYGVEISNILTRLCARNLKRLSINASLLCSDVDNIDLPNGNLIIFLFNPFGKQKIERLLSKVRSRSFETLIIYHNPIYSDVFRKTVLVKTIFWNNLGLFKEQCNWYLVKSKKNKR
jgi:SAM-dependent methyltransferase